MEVKKLNLGCGSDIKEGWVNLDSATIHGIDIVHDIEKLPFPFEDEEFDEILCQDILEHIEFIPVLKDIHRILKKGGRIIVRVPHFTSRNNYVDPTHKKLFSISTFDFFVQGTKLFQERPYYFDFAFEEMAYAHITFDRSSKIFFYNAIAEWFFNLSPKIQRFYEYTGLSRAFPAENIIVNIVK